MDDVVNTTACDLQRLQSQQYCCDGVHEIFFCMYVRMGPYVWECIGFSFFCTVCMTLNPRLNLSNDSDQNNTTMVYEIFKKFKHMPAYA